MTDHEAPRTLEAFEQMRADAELGAAWRECEAALPLRADGRLWDFAVGPVTSSSGRTREYLASAWGDDLDKQSAHALTPAAALRALTVKLQEART